MIVHALMHYRSNSDTWTDGWSDDDYKARNIVKAAKGKDFNGYSIVRSGGRRIRIDDTAAGSNRALALSAALIAKKISAAGYNTASVVPVPASDHTDYQDDFTGSKLAALIEIADPRFKARPYLRFNVAIPKSAEGGGRDTHEIEGHLRARDGIRDLNNVVLLDDVYTTGAHLRAAARFLHDRGIEVEDAFVIARTAWDKPGSMFKCDPEEICI